jgi:hypothetical protein
MAKLSKAERKKRQIKSMQFTAVGLGAVAFILVVYTIYNHILSVIFRGQ